MNTPTTASLLSDQHEQWSRCGVWTKGLNAMNNVFRHLHMPVTLAQDFIATFSRMEYALKAASYANGNEAKVEA